jgi:hypothetical protein
MRRAILVAALVLLALAGVALASASFRQEARIGFTAHRAGQSSGLSIVLVSTDYGVPGGKPKAARQVVLTLPAGTRFNLRSSVSRVCTLSDAELQKPFATNKLTPPTCPIESRVGVGTALLNTNPAGVMLKLKPPLVATVRATVRAYVHSGNELVIVLYLNSQDLPGQPPVILHAHASGERLTVDVPLPIYGRGVGLPHGVSGVIVSLRLTTGPAGSGSNALVRAGRCTRHRFMIKSHFLYRDHSRLDVTSSSSCS